MYGLHMCPGVVHDTTVTSRSVYLYDQGLVILSKDLHKNYRGEQSDVNALMIAPC